MKYYVSYEQANNHWITIEAVFQKDSADPEILQFPSWRPGRYQLGDFAKNVDRVTATINGETAEARKVSKDQWIVDTAQQGELTVKYRYYAAEMNAGSTYLDEHILYMNPVNCLIYRTDDQDAPCSLSLDVPDDYKIAVGLPVHEKVLSANSYHELVDSPFVASKDLEKHSFKVQGVDFHLWLFGEQRLDLERIERDFTAYTEAQISDFGEFPVNEYHYLFLLKTFRDYHGVEHQRSTVIVLGPSCELMYEFYEELLGVSSHELYHTWNIKSLRPAEMHPYDYSRENYSRLGYVAEGVTTYMGDKYLFTSGVFNEEQYFKEFNRLLQRHFDNPGRLNYSVAESSFDTWLDGYEVGVPGRKVSIYNEGALLAFLADVAIVKGSGHEHGLHSAMRKLYEQFAKQGKGFTESDYRNVIAEFAGEDLQTLFDDLIYGRASYQPHLKMALGEIGLELKVTHTSRIDERDFGFRSMADDNGVEVVRLIMPGSPADVQGLKHGDAIKAINKCIVGKHYQQWLRYYKDESVTFTVERQGQLVDVDIQRNENHYFDLYRAIPLTRPDEDQQAAWKAWKRETV